MGKSVNSPVDRWPGFVVLADPMTFGQVLGFKEALAASEELAGDGLKRRQAILPGVLPCIEKWQLANMPTPVTVENFPATPITDMVLFVDWLVSEISDIVSGEEEVPKG